MTTAVYPIYLDHASTSPVDPSVFEAMRPYFLDRFGNASARQHEPGWRAEAAVEHARNQVARALGAAPNEIFFTSGATESNNLAVQGVFSALPGSHWILSSIEHRSVLEMVGPFRQRGVEVDILNVDQRGIVSVAELEKKLKPNTQLVSVMAVNNEVGTVQPIAEIGALCKKHDVWLHVDAVQAVGKILIDVRALGASIVTVNAHKQGGPQGVGAIYVSKKNPRVHLEPIFFGGGHEHGLRPGTLFVAGIVGLGATLQKSIQDFERNKKNWKELSALFTESLFSSLGGQSSSGVEIMGPELHSIHRVDSILNFRIHGVDSASLMTSAKRVAVSSGAACSSVSGEPSHVLQAMGLSEAEARECIRISFGPVFSKISESEIAAQKELVNSAAEHLAEVIQLLRRASE